MNDSSDIWTAQITVMMCAVEALIATHPKPEQVRQVFDQLFGQVQSGVAAADTTQPLLDLMRQLAEKFFLPPETLA